MQRVANLSPADRSEVFQEAANIKGIHPVVIEKDFWVCWVLEKIFSSPDLRPHVVFKGGTSLSKAHGLIARFSEDIDLVLDWRLLGGDFDLDAQAQLQLSRTKRDKFNKAANAKAAEYIGTQLIDRLREIFGAKPGLRCEINPNDAQTINVTYPAAYSSEYLRPEIWLEIGPLASFVPSGVHRIVPYAAEAIPELFDSPGAEVVAISAERTFWEKVTILHQQAHRTGAMPARYSRHYYDLFMLARSPVKHSALSDLQLLEDVVEFKERFYPSPWARYDLARPGTMRISPTEQQTKELARDYREMEVMLLGDAPEFAAIIDTLANLEYEINSLGRKARTSGRSG